MATTFCGACSASFSRQFFLAGKAFVGAGGGGAVFVCCGAATGGGGGKKDGFLLMLFFVGELGLLVNLEYVNIVLDNVK